MICSLRSSFYRFFASGFFIRTVILSLLLALFLYAETCTTDLAILFFRRPRFLDNRLLIAALPKLLYAIPFWAGVFCLRFSGDDLSSRAVNNKIATGLPRKWIYLSDLTVTAFATVITVAVNVGVLYLLGRFLPFRSSVKLSKDIIILSLRMTVIFIAFAAVFMLFQYFFTTGLFGLIISLMIIPAIMVAEMNIDTSLSEPYRIEYIDEDTGEAMWEINDGYIGGTPRKILTALHESIPFREGFVLEKKISTTDTAAAVIVFAASTAAGLVTISRKEFS